MMHFTQKVSEWKTAAMMFVMFFVTIVANALDFGPTPTKFTTSSFDESFEVKFAVCEQANMDIALLGGTQYSLCDAKGAEVAKVNLEVTGYYSFGLKVSGGDVATGTYTVSLPAGTFGLSIQPNITSDAFDVTFVYSGGGETVDPDPNPGTGETTDPTEQSNEAIFVMNDHKGSASVYYMEGQILTSDAIGVSLRFDRVGMENATYSYCYKSNAGYTQFKDCQFTISAPDGVKIQKILFEDGAPSSTTYDLDNFEANGYADGEWTGNAQSVTFSTKVLQNPIYGYDDEDNEYISGYTSEVSGARVAKILVVLDKDVEHTGKVDPEDPKDPEVDPENPEVDPEDPKDPEVDPENPEVDPENPEEVAENVAFFDFTKSKVSSVKGVTLTTDSEWNDYFEALQLYASSTGTVKPATFTAPEGKRITEVRLVESEYASNYGFYYLYANYEDANWECTPSDDYHVLTFVGDGKSITLTANSTSALIAKAYVTLASGEGTGIEGVVAKVSEAVTYDLAGRRVREPKQGLFIQNGVKVVR